MAKVLITEGYLSDIADAIREKKASEDTYTPAEMADAIMTIPTGTAPTGTININTNGTHDVTDYANANVSVPTGTARSSSDLTASNLTVTAPAGLYAENATKTLSDQNLVAGNIKKDVTIFGTTGTYEGGGGGGDSPVETPSVDLVYKEVTVGTNSATDGASVKAYLNDLAGVDSSSKYVWYSLVSTPTTPNNLFICAPFPDSVSMYRYRGGNIVQINFASGYDAVLPVGSKYMVAYAKWKGASLPTA